MPRKPAGTQPPALDKLDSVSRDKCINLLLSGKRGAVTQVAKIANVSRQAVYEYINRHLAKAAKIGTVLARAGALPDEPTAVTLQRAAVATREVAGVLPVLAQREKRLEALQDRHNRMKVVMDERAEEHASVPGGKSGLLVRQIKQIGSGENAQVVEEYRLDTGLLGEFREHEKQLAIELGEWDQGGRPLGGDVVFQNVILMPKTVRGPVRGPQIDSANPQIIDVDSKEVTETE